MSKAKWYDIGSDYSEERRASMPTDLSETQPSDGEAGVTYWYGEDGTELWYKSIKE